jgi:hypothetical protein
MSGAIRVLRMVGAVVLALHGLIHVLGFLALWQLAQIDGLPYRTTVIDGRFEIGETGARLLGLAWLVLVPAFLACAYGLFRGARWAVPAIALVAAVSLVVSILGLPESRPGLMFDVAILAVTGYLTLIVPSGRRRSA